MIEFRPATEADVDALIPMMRLYYAEDGYPFDAAESRSAAVQLIRDRSLGQLWVVHDGDHVVGYLAVALGFSLEHRGRDAFVDELYLAESHRERAFNLYRQFGFATLDRQLMTKDLSG